MRRTQCALLLLLVIFCFAARQASADVFLYELSFLQDIGTRVFGRLAGAQDGCESMPYGDNPVLGVFTPDRLRGFERVYFQGSGILEPEVNREQIYDWLQLARDIKNPDNAASSWVLVIDEQFFTLSGKESLSMSWTLKEGAKPAGTLQLFKPDGSVAVNDLKDGANSVVFAKNPTGQQLGAGRYEIRYRKASVSTAAPATPAPIEDEMGWAATGSKTIVLAASETGKTLQALAGKIYLFKNGKAVSATETGTASIEESGGQWQLAYSLPAARLDAFDQALIGYRVSNSSGAAESLVSLIKAGVPEEFKYPSIISGWNLLAVPPLRLSEDAAVTALLALQPISKNDASRSYELLARGEQLTPCRAFWLFNSGVSSPSITLSGLNTGGGDPSLSRGWNFTGCDGKDNKTVADYKAAYGWQWNGQNYSLLRQSDMLAPGVGYWLYRE